MINRREMLHGMATGVGALLGTSLFPGLARAADTPIIQTAGGPKRVIFFLQNHGFDPLTCIPNDLKESCALSGLTLAEPMKALEPYKNRMHVITGLHGRHTNPGHSAFFGALGGYRGGTVCRRRPPPLIMCSASHCRKRSCRRCASAWNRSIA